MKRLLGTAGWIGIACVLSTTVNVFAQDVQLIENQRTNLVEDATWGDTYVGKYTDENGLLVSNGSSLGSADAFVGFSDTASSNTVVIFDTDTEWSVKNLQIGSESNSFNWVGVWSNGTISIAESLSILGAANSNNFTLGDGGTLKVGSDFNAAIAGFVMETNTTLSVGGTLSNLDEVEGKRHLILTGENAGWLRSTNTVYIGATSDENHLTIEGGAEIGFTNLVVGATGTSSNFFSLAAGSQSTIASNLTLSGQDNGIEVDGDLTLAGDFSIAGLTNSATFGGVTSIDGNLSIDGQNNTAEMGGDFTLGGNLNIIGTSNLFTVAGNAKILGDIDSNTGIQLRDNGRLEASGHVDMTSLDGAGAMVLSGSNARWTTNSEIHVGLADGGTTLEIESDALVQTDRIVIGSTNSVGSQILLSDGGKLILNGNGSMVHSNNVLAVEEDGWLTFGSDFSSAFTYASQSLVWNPGGTVEFQGEAAIFGRHWFSGGEGGDYSEDGTLFLNEGRKMILNGSNAYWNAGTFNLHVGDLSSDNTLVVSNGAWAEVKSMSIGDFSEMGGDDNLVLISGAGTTVVSLNYTAIGGAMLDGSWHEGGEGNVLRVENGASFINYGTLHNQNSKGTSGLEIASGAIVSANNYYQGAGAYLTIFTDDTGTNAGLLRANTAEFEAGARVGVDAVATLQIDQTYTNTIVEANTMIIGGSTNGTTADLSILDASGGSLVDYKLMLEDGTNIVATYSRRYISDSAGFNPDSIIANVSDEIDFLASQGNPAASNQVDILNLMTSAQQRQQMEQLYVYGLPTFMHAQSMLGGIDRVRARGRSAGTEAPTQATPEGAAGPHAEDQGLQGWAKVYGGFGSRAQGDSGFQDGYDAQAYGTVLGLDKDFSDWLFGIAGGYAGSNLEGDNGDGSDATTGYGILYANYGTEDWFADLILSHGETEIDNKTGTAFDTTSTVDASQTGFYIGGGKEAIDENTGVLVRSLLGLQVLQFSQDAYTETSTTAVGKDVNAYDRMSYQSQLGISISMPMEGSKVNFESQFRALWLHEFNGDDELVDYTLVGSNQPGQFILRSPDQDIGQFGIGLLTKWDNGLRFRVDLDAQLSKTFYSTTLSGALLYEF